ncbi:Fur family transcriptional regulator [Breoghania sp. L-A4]|uniref:Fur family transcriptional regulator n=1 Tax=Breoghania sp. L-A4 TaxID=2304600 RepID=UPI000E35FE3E|nr:Fur family transcriptional regulator [Breoghania sp. L-A4]AXS41272.1 transcriptional repressor [Breoghania sp. L-A4]
MTDHIHSAHHTHDRPQLTKNQALVFGALEHAVEPLSAYTILDRLRDSGFRAPLQVYRALEKLVELGMVHRLESLNAFVACSHPECGTHATMGFAICDKCGKVTEFATESVAGQLQDWARSQDFALKKTTIELRGLCQLCQAA